MNYIRGEDKELDEDVDKIRKHLFGFYPGCTIEIISTSNGYISRNLGNRFTATSDKEYIKHIADSWESNGAAWELDPANTYSINYKPSHVKVVYPIKSFFDSPIETLDYLSKDPYKMSPKELEEELKQYFPGFYIGCTMEITDQCPYKQDVGKRFVTADIHGRLQSTVKDIRNGHVFILDPKNTYGINYKNPSWLKVVNPEVTETVPTKELVFGKYHIGQVVVSLCDLIGLRKKNQLFRVLPYSNYDRLYYDHKAASSNFSEWRAATVEETEYYQRMIAKGHKEIILDTPKIDVPCGVYPSHVQDVSYSFNIPSSSGGEVTVKEKQKTDLISDFITTQLKSKQKRVKLSIK